MQTFIDQGYEIIVTTGSPWATTPPSRRRTTPTSGSSASTSPSASTRTADPDPTFACAGDAATLLPNYQGLIFNESQAGYLAGIVAGTLTETNVIGAVGGIDTIPAVRALHRRLRQRRQVGQSRRRGRSSRTSPSDITKAFNDPTTGASIADQMIGQDADFIFQVAGLSGQGALEAACDAGISGIGVDTDQALALPGPHLHRDERGEEARRRGDEAIQRVADGSTRAGRSCSTRPAIRRRSATRRSTTSPTC